MVRRSDDDFPQPFLRVPASLDPDPSPPRLLIVAALILSVVVGGLLALMTCLLKG